MLRPRIAAVGTLVAGWGVVHGQIQILPAPVQPMDVFDQRGSVSADGGMVLMWSSFGSLPGDSSQPVRGRLWTASVGWHTVPVAGEPPWEAAPMAMSGDGRVVFGRNGGSFFRWSEAGGTTLLPNTGAVSLAAVTAASADGGAFVGARAPVAGQFTAFRWTEGGGFVDLPPLPGYHDTLAMGMSADGSVVVGYGNNLGATSANGTVPWFDNSVSPGSTNQTQGRMAYRWTAAGGMQALGEPGAGAGSVATIVSGDGSVVFGYSAGNDQLFRWTESGGMQTLPNTLGATHQPNDPLATNFDGTMMVGLAHTTESYIWTESGGFMSLVDYLGANGLDTTGFINRRMWVTGMSADGLTFAGWGQFSVGFRPFIATVPAPGGAGAGMVMAWVLARRQRRALTAGP